MNREDMTRCMRDGCTYQQVHEINDYIDKLEKENKQLKEQLKQRDEVIDEAIKYIDYNHEYQDVHKQIGINEFEDVTEDILLEKDIEELVKILQKYKGDNNE